MRMKRTRWLWAALLAGLAGALLTSGALAAEPAEVIGSVVQAVADAEAAASPVTTAYVEIWNPLYPQPDETALPEPDMGIALIGEGPSFDESELDAAAAYYRAAMVAREGTVSLCYTTDDYDRDRLLNDEDAAAWKEYVSAAAKEILITLWNAAVEHTGEPDEGDYLRWVYQRLGCSAYPEAVEGSDAVTFHMSITTTYYTTAAQEKELETRVGEILEELALDGMDDYRKTRAIYDYICGHVVYDYENLGDDGYTMKYTAYAALMDGTAVCQGYACLFYNMALRAGLDARLIAGTASGGNHGWNIVKLGELYYALDSTWDANYTDGYKYFLWPPESFSGHTSNKNYAYLFEGYAMAERRFGDLDGDGTMGEGDLAGLMAALVSDTAPTGECDLNLDGTVDVLDVIRLMRLLGKEL